MKELLSRRRKQFYFAIALLFLAIIVLVWPVGLLREDKEYFLAGYYSYMAEAIEDNNFFCQEFLPRHGNVRSIGIFFHQTETEAKQAEGTALVFLTDRADNILFQREISYDEIEFDVYTDIEMNLQLKPRKPYYLNVICGVSSEGRQVSLGLSTKEESLYENQTLYYGEELDGAQLLTRYRYTKGFSGVQIITAFIIVGISALGVFLGIPENRIFRRILGIGIWVMAPVLLGIQLEALCNHPEMRLPFAVLANIAIMYLLETIVLLCTMSLRYSVILTNTFLTLIYTVNYFVNTFRGISFKLNDLAAAGTAIRVADQYDLNPEVSVVMVWLWLLLISVIVFQTHTKEIVGREGRLSIIARHGISLCLGIVLAIGAGQLLLNTNCLETMGFTNIAGWATEVNYREDGFLVATCLNIQASYVPKPEGYSADRAVDLLESYAEGLSAGSGAEDLPHVILIMNESFSDLRVLGSLELSEDNLSFYNGLRKNTVRGYVNASVLGGGTANSEFEVFTGHSMGLLPASYYPYERCVTGPMESLVSMMKEAGYTTYSMHPESERNYNRQSVYRYFGFENSLWKNDFKDAQIVHSGVSDAETYKKIEQLFEGRAEGERLFIFDLTMQNHGDYDVVDAEHTVHALNAAGEGTDAFLSLMKESDLAFEELVQYFESQPEKVVVCMFGDHQPSLSDEFYSAIYNSTEGLSDTDILLNQYKTPFVIWANYDIPERDGVDISMNYLGVLLSQVTGLRQTPYFEFLQEQMEEYPIVTVNGYVNSEGTYSSWGEETDPFSDYRILQYYYLFDR